VAALHATRADRAPARLRARIEAQRRGAEHADGGWLVPRSRFAYGGFAAVVAAAVAVALLLPGGAPGGPSVSEAAALALRGSGRPAPAPDPRNPAATLSKDVEEVYFPNWPSWFGWSAAGLRTDRLAGRQAVTVYYRNHHGQQVAYTIVAAPALRRPGTAARSVNDTTLQQLKLGKRMVITWRRAGHTCVLSGIGVSWGELARLAAWKPAGVTS